MHVGLDRCPGYLRRFQNCPDSGSGPYYLGLPNPIGDYFTMISQLFLTFGSD